MRVDDHTGKGATTFGAARKTMKNGLGPGALWLLGRLQLKDRALMVIPAI